MKKLTSSKCRELIALLTDSQPMTLREEYYLQAIMIACAELEKREKLIELAKRVVQ